MIALSLLKIQILDKRPAAACISRSPTLIAMMQAANLQEGDNVMACRG
jgi:hypothetical protein